MAKKNPLLTGIATLIALVFTAAASSAARTPGAHITIADKNVTVAGRPASSGAAIAPGDTIVTGRRSHAEFTLSDGTVIRIGKGSSFTYTGSKLVLNQGTALVKVAHKGTTVVSGSRTYTGGPAVVSAQAAGGSDGIYILQGGGKVNGATLIAGQTSVLDHGTDRTFTFDLQKLEASSALVTQFPQAPWVAQTEALGSLQHELLSAKVVQVAQPDKGGNSSSNVAYTLALQRGAGSIVSNDLAKLIGSGEAGSLTVSGGTLSLGGSTSVTLTNGAISGLTISAGTIDFLKTGTGTLGGTLVLNGNNGTSGFNASTINAGALIKSGTTLANISSGAVTITGVLSGGTLLLNSGNTVAANTNSNVNLVSGATLVLNTGTGASSTVINNAGSGLTIFNGTANTGTITLTGGTLNGTGAGVLVLNGGTLGSGLTLTQINQILNAGSGGIITGRTGTQQGTPIVVSGVTLPQQPGQIVTINGKTFVTTQLPSGALRYQPVK